MVRSKRSARGQQRLLPMRNKCSLSGKNSASKSDCKRRKSKRACGQARGELDLKENWVKPSENRWLTASTGRSSRVGIDIATKLAHTWDGIRLGEISGRVARTGLDGWGEPGAADAQHRADGPGGLPRVCVRARGTSGPAAGEDRKPRAHRYSTK
jgi:hypothetical protein